MRELPLDCAVRGAIFENYHEQMAGSYQRGRCGTRIGRAGNSLVPGALRELVDLFWSTLNYDGSVVGSGEKVSRWTPILGHAYNHWCSFNGSEVEGPRVVTFNELTNRNCCV